MSSGDYVFGGRREPEAPHTTEARGGRAVARAVSQRVGFPAAWWGIAMLIASEGTIMACFIATYYYLRIRAVEWPPPGIPEPRVVVPLVLAGVLATTSVPMQLASLAARAGRVAPTRAFLLLALIVQTGYLAYEIHDFGDQLKEFGVTADAYSSIYYTLLGADHAHVALGLLFDLWLLTKLVRGLTTYRANGVIAITWYWHFVNFLTLIVIGTLTSAVPL
jgi:heme/copper-type cytochrome/quinol oxidase subunit 3